MKQPLQTTLLGLAVSLILSCFAANADTAKTTTPEIEYQRYYSGDPEGRKYHPLLLSPIPEELIYRPLLTATANIDDTPEKETVVLILVYMKTLPRDDGWMRAHGASWLQAFLFITEADTKAKGLKRKDAFKFFDAGAPALDVPAAKSIELRNPPLVFVQSPEDAFKSRDISFKLVDLTGDGTLDVWIESIYGVAAVSFQNGEFREIFNSYTIAGPLPDADYVDLDNDGIYEIKIPYSIQIQGFPGAPYLPWISLYEWDGTTYILNNERFYAENNDYLIQLLGQYNYLLLRHGHLMEQSEIHRFYLGLVYYYRGNKSPSDLEWILKHAKTDDYIQVAKSLLGKLPSPQR